MQRCYGCMKEYGKEYDVCPYCGYIVGTSPGSKTHLNPGIMLSGRYTVGKAIGHGGFGITYIAWDDKLQKTVAVKEYFPNAFSTRSEGDTQISCLNADAERFFSAGVKKMLDEARRLSSFSKNENIVDIYNFFEENNTAYIVMEYLEGKNLKQYLEENGGKLAPERAVELILPVLNALEDMHKEHLIHRDISPDNIYLCNDGKVKLLDFGSARLASEDSEKSLSVMLKRGFAPKEQYSSRSKQGTWTDVYAVCATLYKMITGETPIESTDRDDEELKTFGELGINGCDELEKIILKGMAIKPVDRIQSVQELGAQLIVANKSEAEKEPEKQEISQQEKGKKPVNIKIIIAAVAAVVIVAVLSVLGVKYIKNNSEPSGQITSSVTTTEESKVTLVETGEPEWKKAYVDVVKEASGDDVSFELGYVDDDEIPELFVSLGRSHVDGVTVYTYSNGNVVKLCDTGSFGSTRYVERKGYICGYYMGFGIINTSVHKLENGKVTDVFFTTDESYADDLVLKGREKKYTINGKAVTPEEMTEYYIKYFGADLWEEDAVVTSSEIKFAPSIEVTDENIQKHITDFKVGEEYTEESKVTLVETGEPAWKKAYADLVRSAVGTDVRFALGYVDDNEIPELFLATDSVSDATVQIYTYLNNESMLVSESGFGGTVDYIEREGYICTYSQNQGGTGCCIEKLENGKVTEVYSSSDNRYVYELYNVERILTINEKPVTEAEIEAFYLKYFADEDLANYESGVEHRVFPDLNPTDENIKKHITDFKS